MSKIWIGVAVILIAIAGGIFLFSSLQKNEAKRVAQTQESYEVIQAEGGSYKNINSAQLREMLQHKDFFFVNTHIPYEGEIESTDAFVPYNEIEAHLNTLPSDKNAKIVLYCRSGRMSEIAAKTMVKLGYTNIWNHTGGMINWERQGHKLIHKQ
jgi:rhodanese-related sulfurtransferase